MLTFAATALVAFVYNAGICLKGSAVIGKSSKLHIAANNSQVDCALIYEGSFAKLKES